MPIHIHNVGSRTSSGHGGRQGAASDGTAPCIPRRTVPELEERYRFDIVFICFPVGISGKNGNRRTCNRGQRTEIIGVVALIVSEIPAEKQVDSEMERKAFRGSSLETFRLRRTLKRVFNRRAEQAVAGNHIADIGAAVEQCAHDHGYGVVRELCGHGLGKKVHEDPLVPNYGTRGHGERIENGMVLAIEPMINLGTHRIRELSDGWTILTKDLKPSAHFEHDIAVLDGRPVLLSTYKYIYEALGVESAEEEPFLYPE